MGGGFSQCGGERGQNPVCSVTVRREKREQPGRTESRTPLAAVASGAGQHQSLKAGFTADPMVAAARSNHTYIASSRPCVLKLRLYRCPRPISRASNGHWPPPDRAALRCPWSATRSTGDGHGETASRPVSLSLSSTLEHSNSQDHDCLIWLHHRRTPRARQAGCTDPAGFRLASHRCHCWSEHGGPSMPGSLHRSLGLHVCDPDFFLLATPPALPLALLFCSPTPGDSGR